MTAIRHIVLYLCIIAVSACSPGIRFRPGEIPAPPAEDSERINAGRALYQELTKEATVYRNKAAEKRVAKITSRVLGAAPPMGHWEVTLIDSKEFNAMTTPGNYIYVFRGLLEQLPNDDEVAAVIAHEIAHRLGRHDIESSSEKWGKALTVLAGIAAGVAVGSQPGATQNDIANTMSNTIKIGSGFTTLQYSKDKEREADQIGIFLMADAGYDPSGFASVWARRASQEGVQGDFFSTHPNSDERYQNAIQLLPMAKERYRLARKKARKSASRKKSVPLSVHYEAAQGYKAINNREVYTARTIAQSLTQRAPHQPDGYNILGLSHFIEGDQKYARKSFLKGLQVDPDYAPLLYNVACIDVQERKYDSALKKLEKAFIRSPQLVETARDDSDLSALRSHPRFNALLNRYYPPPPPSFKGSNSFSINTY